MPTKNTRRTKADLSKLELDALASQPRADYGLSTERFRKSDRLQMALAGTRNRFGASCNTFVVGDSIASIAEAHAWALHVSHMQGAPSVHYGALRPRGSKISTGGVSGGAVPFMHMLDASVHHIKRDTYKKGAGIAWLPWNHPDLPEFLTADFLSIYRGVTIPGNHEPALQQEFLRSEQAELLAQAYEKGKCFICKEPEPTADGETIVLNLCTEVELPSRGSCVLGVVNLSQYTPDNVGELAEDFVSAANEMLQDSRTSRQLQDSYPHMRCTSAANVQFGLGVSGLASMLANWGISYADFVLALNTRVEQGFSISELFTRSLRRSRSSLADNLVHELLRAYHLATEAVAPYVCKAFCVQPSATGAYECADSSGYYSSPELQPVIGIRDKSGVHTIRKSQLKGDTVVEFHPATETIDEVPYALYARLCHLWQVLLDSTGLAHRHSACYYGNKFTLADLRQFVESAQKSLYYRLPQYNPAALDKSQVGSGLEFAEDFSLDSLLVGGSCNFNQQPDDSDCGCSG